MDAESSARIESRVDTIEEEIGKLRERYHRLAAQVVLREEAEAMRSDGAARFDGLRADISTLREEFAAFRGRVGGIAAALVLLVPLLTAVGTVVLDKMIR